MESSSRAIWIAGTTTKAERGKTVIVPFSETDLETVDCS
jgi:hypothetical protein